MKTDGPRSVRLRIASSTIFKLVLIEIAVSAIAFGLSTYLTARSLRDGLYSEVSQKARLTLSTLRVSTALLMREGRPEEVQRLMDNAGASRVVKSLRLISARDGAVLASTDPSELGAKVSSPLIERAIANDSLFEMSGREEIDEGFEAIIPVSGALFDTHLNSDTAAYLEYRADMSVERSLERKVQRALAAQTAHLLVLMLAATLAAWVMIISRPVKYFLSVTEKVGAGDYDARIDVRHHDELSMFAHAFNDMVEEVGRKNEELFKYSETLEARVEERTQSLLNKTVELEQTRKRAIEAERTALAGRIAGGVAHEINNPSAFVMSNLGHLERSIGTIKAIRDRLASIPELTPQDMERLDGFLSSAPLVLAESKEGIKRIASIVQSLELSAFPDRGGMVRADISALLAESIGETCSTLRADGRAACSLEPGLESARVPILLSTAFKNVLANAVSAAGDSGRVSISSEREGDWAVVRFIDSGSGIPEAIIENIFEPFFTTKDPGKGIGLGLTVAKAIVESGGGEIAVESSPGRTVFLIRLPLPQAGRGSDSAIDHPEENQPS